MSNKIRWMVVFWTGCLVAYWTGQYAEKGQWAKFAVMAFVTLANLSHVHSINRTDER